jgi:hypothetical protein
MRTVRSEGEKRTPWCEDSGNGDDLQAVKSIIVGVGGGYRFKSESGNE